MEYVKTQKQLTDILTKPLGHLKMEELRFGINNSSNRNKIRRVTIVFNLIADCWFVYRCLFFHIALVDYFF